MKMKIFLAFLWGAKWSSLFHDCLVSEMAINACVTLLTEQDEEILNDPATIFSINDVGVVILSGLIDNL